MNEGMGLEISDPEELRDKARELTVRHGEHAEEYVRARIEACQTAGASAEAEAWRLVLNLLA
jgi:hypothetical protein